MDNRLTELMVRIVPSSMWFFGEVNAGNNCDDKCTKYVSIQVALRKNSSVLRFQLFMSKYQDNYTDEILNIFKTE